MNRHSFTRRTKHLFSLAILMTLSLSMFAQRNVSGKVTDETGQSLVGATVLVKGTTSGTATDINGAFTVSLPEGSSILEISYTGYQSMDVSAEGQDNISIQLAAGSEMLDQVVVVGYGRQKKSQLTGAISSIEEGGFFGAEKLQSDLPILGAY